MLIGPNSKNMHDKKARITITSRRSAGLSFFAKAVFLTSSSLGFLVRVREGSTSTKERRTYSHLPQAMPLEVWRLDFLDLRKDEDSWCLRTKVLSVENSWWWSLYLLPIFGICRVCYGTLQEYTMSPRYRIVSAEKRRRLSSQWTCLYF